MDSKFFATYPSVGRAFMKTPYAYVPRLRLNGDRRMSYGAQPQKYVGGSYCASFLLLL